MTYCVINHDNVLLLLIEQAIVAKYIFFVSVKLSLITLVRTLDVRYGHAEAVVHGVVHDVRHGHSEAVVHGVSL